ncbi:hypothetical protein PR048_032218 [Dryococelus australis]|uniref:Uncharacterized protein n=1 Tax=Dryococelus australis TaxID=614101 RepID=A0ABQ9G1N0_9NEOP|nr:hypothetical protein PR048_032218 [Dryococelus australis]
MGQSQNARAGYTGDLLENPLTSGIVGHDSCLRKSGTLLKICLYAHCVVKRVQALSRVCLILDLHYLRASRGNVDLGQGGATVRDGCSAEPMSVQRNTSHARCWRKLGHLPSPNWLRRRANNAKQPLIQRSPAGVTGWQNVVAPFANQRLVTCPPAGSPANKGTFRSTKWPIRRKGPIPRAPLRGWVIPRRINPFIPIVDESLRVAKEGVEGGRRRGKGETHHVCGRRRGGRRRGVSPPPPRCRRFAAVHRIAAASTRYTGRSITAGPRGVAVGLEARTPLTSPSAARTHTHTTPHTHASRRQRKIPRTCSLVLFLSPLSTRVADATRTKKKISPPGGRGSPQPEDDLGRVRRPTSGAECRVAVILPPRSPKTSGLTPPRETRGDEAALGLSFSP